MTLDRGLSLRIEAQVGLQDLAQAAGSGDLPVLATPRLACLMENAAMRAVAPCLPAEQTTVGSEIYIQHLRPTAEGSVVSVEAVLTEVDGRRLTFNITAAEGDQVIGRATHVRYIVDRERFMAKLK